MNRKATILTIAIMLLFSLLISAQPLTPKEELGKKIFFDKISSPDNMSCADCHAPEAGFTGPIPGINKHGAVYRGAVPQRFGNRKPPSSAYATFSPILYYDGTEGLFIGGNFWDGRATGEFLGNPAADQALGPFLNPVEQNNSAPIDVLLQIKSSRYFNLWMDVWGSMDLSTPGQISQNYDRVGLSVAAYESSAEVNSFTSKFDYYLEGMVDLTDQELEGLALFEGDAMCSACHPSEYTPGGMHPLFTDFTYDNLGTPKNPDNPFYGMDNVFLAGGSPINPEGSEWIDNGLGGFLQTVPAWQTYADDNMGKHKVPTLRNVDKRPGEGFPKAFMHNGVFKSLKEVVHFYNTRDVEGAGWPPPEVAANVNTSELGDLGLSAMEEDAIVAFMTTLSDGFRIDLAKSISNNLKFTTELKINGPNPFNPSTKLLYIIPEDMNIQLEVFNMTGEKVKTLYSGHASAGTHEVVFNSGNLASGVYIVSLYTGKEIRTQKLLLMK